jgi:hypothetical protein
MGASKTKIGAWMVLAAVGVLPARAEDPPLPETNAKVVEFARAHLGKKVGDGVCITLAIEAMREAGARRFPLDDPVGDYAWGRRVDAFKDALPGDILQFRDAEFKGKAWLSRRRWITWHSSYPHHTAIVSGVKNGGKLVTVLHQNVSGPGKDGEADKKLVREDTLRVDSLQPGGWVRIYRPIPRDPEPE